jgi:hypothetical protein
MCGIEIDCEDLRKFFDPKRPNGDSHAVEKTNSVFPIDFLNSLQYLSVGLVEGLGQFIKSAPDARRETLPQRLKLTIHPSEPV